MRKWIISVIIVLIMSITILTVSLAASYNVIITVKDVGGPNIQQGQTATILIKLNDIDLSDIIYIENGMKAVSGKIEYDTEVFEQLTASDVSSCPGWESLSYTDQGDNAGEFVVPGRAIGDPLRGESISDLIEISLTARTNAPTGETKIKITNIKASIDGEEVTTSEVTGALLILGDNEYIPANNTTTNSSTIDNTSTLNNTNNNTPTLNNTNNNTPALLLNNTTNNNTTNNNATTNEDIPKAGIEDNIMPIILILLMIAIVSYIRYNKIKKI